LRNETTAVSNAVVTQQKVVVESVSRKVVLRHLISLVKVL